LYYSFLEREKFSFQKIFTIFRLLGIQFA